MNEINFKTSPRRRKMGVTLISLMMTTATIAVMAALSFPAYFVNRRGSQQTLVLAALRQYIMNYRITATSRSPFFKMNGKKFVVKEDLSPGCNETDYSGHRCFRTIPYRSTTVGNCIWHLTPIFDSKKWNITFHLTGADGGKNCGCYDFLLKRAGFKIDTSPCQPLTDECRNQLVRIFRVDSIF